jgi:hypothetical protein
MTTIETKNLALLNLRSFLKETKTKTIYRNWRSFRQMETRQAIEEEKNVLYHREDIEGTTNVF